MTVATVSFMVESGEETFVTFWNVPVVHWESQGFFFSGVGCASCKTMCQINKASYWEGIGGLVRHDSSSSGAVIKSVACLEVSVTLFILIFQSQRSVQWVFKEELARDRNLLVSVVFGKCVFPFIIFIFSSHSLLKHLAVL